jgi:glycosyltransferase involved in cell wall biosynthesis
VQRHNNHRRKSNLKLSVITVNLNNVQGLKTTLGSVAVQTFRDFEHIVIDGGSTDGSRSVIEAHADRIVHWLSEPDAGIYNAMNKGLRLAQGDYVHFLNSGDRLVSPDLLGRVFGESPCNDDLLYGNTIRPDKAGVLYECRHPAPLTVSAFWGFGVCQQAIFYKRNLFDRLGCFDETLRIAGDWDFNLRVLMARGATRHLPFPVVHYQGGGISVTRPEEAAREKEAILKRHLPDAVHRDYERLMVLEKQSERLKTLEDRVAYIQTRNPLVNMAMVLRWSWRHWAGSAKGGNGDLAS